MTSVSLSWYDMQRESRGSEVPRKVEVEVEVEVEVRVYASRYWKVKGFVSKHINRKKWTWVRSLEGACVCGGIEHQKESGRTTAGMGIMG